MIDLSVVVPCYNEEEVLPQTASRLLEQLNVLRADGQISAESCVYFVDDGSRDATWRLIEELARTDSRVHGIKLSRNRGHQNALLAGLFTARGDAVVSIDADLQDDVGAIDGMVRAHAGGADIVYGVRRRRDTDSAFKKYTALSYYRLLAKLGVQIVYNHADYRLMSRRAIDALAQYRESNMFLRGIIPLLGFNTATVYYDRAERAAGVSKYPLRRMLGFALNGVTSFSATPLRAITALGFFVAVLSILGGGWVIWERLWGTGLVPGWASILVPVFFLGGVQMLCLGVIGEYVAKIYIESKGRPRYFIDRQL